MKLPMLLWGLWLLPALAQTPNAVDRSRDSWFGGTNQARSKAIALQPLAQQIRRLESALELLGQPLSKQVEVEINLAISEQDEAQSLSMLQQILEPYVLINVEINPESRVKVDRGTASPQLVQGGSRYFLVKVSNNAGVTAALNVSSPNNGNVYLTSDNDPSPAMVLTAADVRDRWAAISMPATAPLERRLTGFALEYQIIEIFSRDAGQRSASMDFSVGQGTRDLAFRNQVSILFTAAPSRPVKLHFFDELGKPTIASLTVRDNHGRLYPNPSKRLAPDLYFQPQVYRADGETIDLPPGRYTATVKAGPEYTVQTEDFELASTLPESLTFSLQRWIDPSQFGWYSGDTHVHAAGCSHYKNPSEGVLPKDMMRQIEGEKLNIGSVLTWGPDYYYQKQFFSGSDDPLSNTCSRMHYDLEVSGFPSSHAGHLVLLGLKDQYYPGTKKIEDWPTWDLPILQWAAKQNAVVGFAHSGWGLQVADDHLPSFQIPGYDGIGANEYIVDVTQPGTVDFLSVGDTPYVWELSSWYHTLNLGFRTRIAGETDFPCITDERVGLSRSYVKLNGPLTYNSWLDGLKAGHSYVSDGRSHLIDFQLDGKPGPEIQLDAAGTIHATVHAAALLSLLPDQSMERRPADQKPYWSVERARVNGSREVNVELVVNGVAVARKPLLSDGLIHDLTFDAQIEQSSWVALRIPFAAHTNPIFVTVSGKPIRASKASAEWALAAVQQCWTQKAARIAAAEQGAAHAAYQQAKDTYRRLAAECVH